MGSEQTSACTELSKYSHPLLLSHKDLPKEKVLGRLKLFESLLLPGQGGIAFAGGRVSVLKWHPTARGILAAAAHRSEQLFHEVLRTYSGPAHIQIWRMSRTGAACLGVIPHNGDCTWDLKWRPRKGKAESTNKWSGTFAAALGDGCILISNFENVTQTASGYDSLTGQVQVLPHSKTLLRVHKKPFLRRPVRVLEWSLDGTRLLVGSVNGFVEVYEASSDNSMWPKWTIPAQESIVSDMKWLNPSLFCTLGISCVLRLRDIRDPVATIEQNAEGLAGSLSMSMAEPNVAIVGGDTGYLRVVRLRGTDNFNAKHPVRRVYVQGSSFRTMQAISAPSPKGSRTVLYTGGCEGIVHEISFPRPLWPEQDQCTISRTRVGQLLRWCVEKSPAKAKDNDDILHLILGDACNEGVHDKNKGKATSSDREGSNVRNGRSQASSRKKTKVSGPHGADKPLFGDSYHQSIVVTRVDVSIQDGMIAVGIDGGIITWLPLDHENIDSSLAEEKVAERPAKPSASVKKKAKTKKSSESNLKASRTRSGRTRSEVRKVKGRVTGKEGAPVQEKSTRTHGHQDTDIKSTEAEKSAEVSRRATRKRARSTSPASSALRRRNEPPAGKDKKSIGATTRSKASLLHAEKQSSAVIQNTSSQGSKKESEPPVSGREPVSNRNEERRSAQGREAKRRRTRSSNLSLQSKTKLPSKDMGSETEGISEGFNEKGSRNTKATDVCDVGMNQEKRPQGLRSFESRNTLLEKPNTAVLLTRPSSANKSPVSKHRDPNSDQPDGGNLGLLSIHSPRNESTSNHKSNPTVTHESKPKRTVVKSQMKTRSGLSRTTAPQADIANGPQKVLVKLRIGPGSKKSLRGNDLKGSKGRQKVILRLRIRDKLEEQVHCKVRIRAPVESEASGKPQTTDHVTSSRKRKRLPISDALSGHENVQQEASDDSRAGTRQSPAKKKRPCSKSLPEANPEPHAVGKELMQDPAVVRYTQSTKDSLHDGNAFEDHDATCKGYDTKSDGRPRRNRRLTWRMRGD